MLRERSSNPAEPATRSRSHYHVQRAEILGLIGLLLGMSLALRSPPLPPDGVAWSLPLPSGRTITVWLWTHDLAFSTAYATGGLTRQTPGPLRLTVAIQRTATSPYQRLMVRRVPVWPLLMWAGMLGLLAAGMERGRGVGSGRRRTTGAVRNGAEAPPGRHQHRR